MLSNSKQEALSVALDGGRKGGGVGESSVEDLTRAITDDVIRMPGNNSCCDCGAPGLFYQSTACISIGYDSTVSFHIKVNGFFII